MFIAQSSTNQIALRRSAMPKWKDINRRFRYDSNKISSTTYMALLRSEEDFL
jgi:hypothetical protein